MCQASELPINNKIAGFGKRNSISVGLFSNASSRKPTPHQACRRVAGDTLWRAGRRAELIAPFSHDAGLPPTKGEEKGKGRVEEPRLHTSETISPVPSGHREP